MTHCKYTGKIENDLTNRKKVSLVSTCCSFKKKFTIFSRLYLYFPDFFQVQKIAGQISRLFQEFKTLYRPCLSSFKISLKKYIINSCKSRRFEQFHYHRSLPVLQLQYLSFVIYDLQHDTHVHQWLLQYIFLYLCKLMTDFV